MSLDADVHRDDEAAFGRHAVLAGAILPYAGRAALQRPDGVPAAVLDADADGWAAVSLPVLVRGPARIVPLGWLGDPQHSPRGVAGEEIDALAAQMQATGMHWAGPWRVLDLDERRSDSIGSYAAALHAAGATSADCGTAAETWRLALGRAGGAEAGSLAALYAGMGSLGSTGGEESQ